MADLVTFDALRLAFHLPPSTRTMSSLSADVTLPSAASSLGWSDRRKGSQPQVFTSAICRMYDFQGEWGEVFSEVPRAIRGFQKFPLGESQNHLFLSALGVIHNRSSWGVLIGAQLFPICRMAATSADFPVPPQKHLIVWKNVSFPSNSLFKFYQDLYIPSVNQTFLAGKSPIQMLFFHLFFPYPYKSPLKQV